MKYLGFIIKVGVGLQMDPEKIKVIREWEAFKIKKGGVWPFWGSRIIIGLLLVNL